MDLNLLSCRWFGEIFHIQFLCLLFYFIFFHVRQIKTALFFCTLGKFNYELCEEKLAKRAKQRVF